MFDAFGGDMSRSGVLVRSSIGPFETFHILTYC